MVELGFEIHQCGSKVQDRTPHMATASPHSPLPTCFPNTFCYAPNLPFVSFQEITPQNACPQFCAC